MCAADVALAFATVLGDVSNVVCVVWSSKDMGVVVRPAVCGSHGDFRAPGNVWCTSDGEDVSEATFETCSVVPCSYARSPGVMGVYTVCVCSSVGRHSCGAFEVVVRCECVTYRAMSDEHSMSVDESEVMSRRLVSLFRILTPSLVRGVVVIVIP